MYACSLCDEWSSHSAQETKIHMSKKHNVCHSVVQPCMQQFSSRKELIKHWILTSHFYYCHICDGGHPSEAQFLSHPCMPRKDAIIDGIKCPVCGMMAPTQAAYDTHWDDTAQDARHYRCNKCHKIVTDENQLLEKTVISNCTYRVTKFSARGGLSIRLKSFY